MSENEKEIEKLDRQEKEDKRIEQIGQLTLGENKDKKEIHLLTIIGEIEGHENLSNNTSIASKNASINSSE